MPTNQKTTEVMGDNSGSQILSFVQRIEKLEEDKREISDDIKDIYAEAKSTGFDVKIIRKVVKRRRMTADKRREEDELLDLYETALQNLNSMME